MRLRTVEIEGFQSYREREVIDFEGIDMAAITGPARSGKTSLINAVEYALFGKFRGDGVASVISRGSKRAVVVLTFDHGDATYRVRRVRTSAGSPEVYVERLTDAGWKELHEKNPRYADPFIVSLLGMDDEMSRATWLINQSNFDDFCRAAASQRRATLIKAFHLDSYAELLKRAEARRTRAEIDLAVQQRATEDLSLRADGVPSGGPHEDVDDSALADLMVAAAERLAQATEHLTRLRDESGAATEQRLRERHDDLAQRHEADLAAHQREAALLARAVESAQQEVDRAHALCVESKEQQSALAELQSERDGLTERADEVAALLRETDAHIETLREDRVTAAAELATARTQRDAVDERISSLESSDGTCWTCESPLTHSAQEHLLDQVRAERDDVVTHGRSVAERASTLDRELEEATATRKNLDTEARDLGTRLQGLEGRIERAREVAGHLETRVAELRRQRRALKKAEVEQHEQGPAPARSKELVGLTRRLADLADTADRRREVAAAEDEVEAAREHERDLWAEAEHRKRRTALREALRDPLRLAEEKVAALQAQVNHLSLLARAFRPSGIPAMVLAGVVEELNIEANDLLESMGDDDRVEVAVVHTGGEDKVVVRVVVPDGSTVEFSTLSGSEGMLVALALRIGLLRCIARRAGAPVETIFIEEIWNPLDATYKQGLQDALESVAEEAMVLVVPHDAWVAGQFPHHLDVDLSSGTSRVERITTG